MPAKKKSSYQTITLRLQAWMITGAIGLAIAGAPCTTRADEHPQPSPGGMHLAQEGELPPEDTDVPPPEVDKYIKVYQAMQHNRNLTVEQAAAQQGLSVTAFRSLENRIQRNDALREHVRDSLKPQASPTPAQ